MKIPLLLFVITIISRIPFTSKLLYHMDSGHFALALEKYDVTVHQPHPPGYFLYIMLGRLVNLFIKDANSTFIFISILFSGLTVVAVYYLGREMFTKRSGIIAALVAMTSPNLWFHGEVALTYAVEAFFSVMIAFLCWKIYKGEHKYIWLSAILLGIAGGIRQNTMIFLLPLWLFSIKGVNIRKIIASFGLLVITCILWFIPMLSMTGGWTAYRDAFEELWLFNTGHISVFEKGWSSFKIFFSSFFKFTMYSIGAGILILSLTAYSLIRNKRLKLIEKYKLLFFSLWILPSVFFYLLIFIHPSNPGYVLIFQPALSILIAISIEYIGTELKQLTRKDFINIIASVIIIINTGIFFFLSDPTTYREIRIHDRDLAIILDGIKTFNPDQTAIFIPPYTFYSYRNIMYYLPEYRVYDMDLRIAPNGKMRKIFWGYKKETHLSEGIVLPKNINTFINIHSKDDTDKIRQKGFKIKKLPPTYFDIAYGPILSIKEIYPKLTIQIQ
jgi:hypothetical protein